MTPEQERAMQFVMEHVRTAPLEQLLAEMRAANPPDVPPLDPSYPTGPSWIDWLEGALDAQRANEALGKEQEAVPEA